MAFPEGTKLRRGDVVALHATVKYDMDDGDGSIFVDVPGASSVIVHPDQVAGIVRRRFDRGEEVKPRIPSPYAGETFVVEAVSECGGSLWLRRRGGGFATLGADEVSLVEPEPAPPAAPEDWDNARSGDDEAAQ